MTNRKEHTKASIYTAITLVVVLLFLLFFGFKVIVPDTEEGILVDFGNSSVGTGQSEPAPSVQQSSAKPKAPTVETQVAKTVPQTSVDVKETVETQDFEDAPVVESGKRKQDTEADKAQKAEELRKQAEAKEAERLKKIAEEKERKRLEEIERLKREEAAKLERERLERERKAAEIRQRTQNAFGGGAGTAATQGEGVTGDPGNQGSTNGAANTGSYSGSGLGSSGSGFELTGRSLNGSLPQPTYNVQEEGVVVVQIEVERSGKVVSATPIFTWFNHPNPELQRVAREAALKARFNDNPTAPLKQVGTITYHFRLD